MSTIPLVPYVSQCWSAESTVLAAGPRIHHHHHRFQQSTHEAPLLYDSGMWTMKDGVVGTGVRCGEASKEREEMAG